jgi:cell division septal protein FtsQ
MKLVVPVAIKTRQRWSWRRLLRVPWLRIALCAAAVGLIYYLLGSGTFTIRRVEAIGDARLPQLFLQQQCYCMGSNIFLLQPEKVRQRLQSIPTLVVDDVYGRLPNRVIVEAHYKKPRMIWHSRTGYFFADVHGQLFARVTGRRPLPVIAVRQTQRLAIGQTVDTGAMATVGDLIRLLPSSLRSQVTGFYYSPISGVTIATRRHWSATFGWLTGLQLQERIVVLEWALQRKALGQVPPFNYVDLRFSTPYARLNKVWLDPQWTR